MLGSVAQKAGSERQEDEKVWEMIAVSFTLNLKKNFGVFLSSYPSRYLFHIYQEPMQLTMGKMSSDVWLYHVTKDIWRMDNWKCNMDFKL